MKDIKGAERKKYRLFGAFITWSSCSIPEPFEILPVDYGIPLRYFVSEIQTWNTLRDFMARYCKYRSGTGKWGQC